MNRFRNCTRRIARDTIRRRLMNCCNQGAGAVPLAGIDMSSLDGGSDAVDGAGSSAGDEDGLQPSFVNSSVFRGTVDFSFLSNNSVCDVCSEQYSPLDGACEHCVSLNRCLACGNLCCYSHFHKCLRCEADIGFDTLIEENVVSHAVWIARQKFRRKTKMRNKRLRHRTQ